MKTASRKKYPDGGVISTDLGPGERKSILTPKQIREKYKSNPYVNNGRENWGQELNKTFPLSGGKVKVKDAVLQAAKITGIKPALLYSSAMEEGVQLALLHPDDASEAYVDWSEKNKDLAGKYPVDGFYNYGLDTFGDNYKYLQKKGYLPQGFDQKFKIFDATNEKNQTVKTAAFASDADALTAKAAMIKQAQDTLSDYAKKRNLNLTDKQKDFFTLAGYNSGLGNIPKMVDSYNQKGYLKDDKFLDPTFKPASWAGVYTNVQRRLQNRDVLLNEGYFEKGGKMPDGGVIDMNTPQKSVLDPDYIENPFAPKAPVNPDTQKLYEIDRTGSPVKKDFNILPVNLDWDFPGDKSYEKFASLGMTGINALLGNNSNAQLQRSNYRKVLEENMKLNQNINPYPQGNGSQAIMKFGGNLNGGGDEDGKKKPLTPQELSNWNRVISYAKTKNLTPDQLDHDPNVGFGIIDEYNKLNPEYQFDRNRVRDIQQLMADYRQKTIERFKNYTPQMLKLDNPAERFGSDYAKFMPGLSAPDNFPGSKTLNWSVPKEYLTVHDNSTDQKTTKEVGFAPITTTAQTVPHYATGGEMQGKSSGLNITDGGKAQVISSSDHSNPMIEFTGKTHDEGGIGLNFGGNEAEVEDKEVGWVDNSGSLNIFGKLKVPGTNKTFRKVAKDLAKQESKIDARKSMYLDTLTKADDADPYQASALSTAKIMFKSLDKQSKEIAENKEAISSYQNLILSMTDKQPHMKYGGRIEYAEGGELSPDSADRIQKIIDKYSGGKAPVTANDFIEVSKKYGVPIDLMLAQAIQESHFGTAGRAVRTKNIFNVGNTDDGSANTQSSWKEGLEKYAKLIKDEYDADGKDISTQEILNNNFTRPKKGGTYASDKNYTSKVSRILQDINPDAGYTTPLEKADPVKSQVTSIPALEKYSSDLFTPVHKGNPNKPEPTVYTPYGAATTEATDPVGNINVGNNDRKRGYMSPLKIDQIAPELLAIAKNKQEPVFQPSYQPALKQTFDTSFQSARNDNQSSFNQLVKVAESTGDLSILPELAAQKYKADQAVNSQEIQGNAANKLNIYSANTDTLNKAQEDNISLFGQQAQQQAAAKFNTQKQFQDAFTSIVSKTQQNELENKTYNAYANLFKNYGFDNKGNVTFNPDKVARKFSPTEAAQFGMLSAKEGADKIINKVDNKGKESTTTIDNSDLDDLVKARKALAAGATYSDIIEAMPKLAKYKSLQAPQ